jgi:hypothetical protein
MFDREAPVTHPPEHIGPPHDGRAHGDEQMTLFARHTSAPRPRTRLSRNEKMAARLEQLAEDWDTDALAARRAGDQVTERRFRDQARDARRSAQVLRAGPGGASRLLAS